MCNHVVICVQCLDAIEWYPSCKNLAASVTRDFFSGFVSEYYEILFSLHSY